MGTIWVKEFVGGLDARRMPETTPGGVLIVGRDGHISRGGEFVKRPAFVEEYTLPEGTVGMAAGKRGIIVFGNSTAPVGIPTGVSYMKLSNANALVDVPSYDLYAGKVYTIGTFADGTVHHFYDGLEVADLIDSRARAVLTLTAGGITAAVRATGSLTVTGGTAGIGNEFTSFTINGVSVINPGSTVQHTGNNATTAQLIADAVNNYNSLPDYTAVAVGAVVTFTAADAGAAPNGWVVNATVVGDVTFSKVNMAGGANTITSTLTNLTVNAIPIIGKPVVWQAGDTTTTMASRIADAIQAFNSEPEYDAFAYNNKVIIRYTTPSTAPNGWVVTPVVAGGLTFTPGTTAMAGGAALPTSPAKYTPGQFNRTVGSKTYMLSDSVMHFTGVGSAVGYQGVTGSGFIDMSTYTSGAEELMALARYQGSIAVFAERVIQIWYVDPDPALNKFGQLLNNTGTASPKSVTQFGDADLFYLDESGVRSLKARDSSNAAATTDIGVPVDDLVTAKLHDLSTAQREKIVGLIEPQDGRFWLIFPDGTIFVFSFFPGSKVSAWTTYETGFRVDAAVVYRRRVYLRSGNKIYVFGGLSEEPVYDNTEAEAWTPYLDAGAPTQRKEFQGIDMACTGEWEVQMATTVTDTTASEVVARPMFTTFDSQKIDGVGEGTHIMLRFISKEDGGAAKISSAVIHYTGAPIAD